MRKLWTACLLCGWMGVAVAAEPVTPEIEAGMLKKLDAPLLFVKRHSYTGIHIYDTYYKWPGAGGGIYVLENPSAPKAEWKVRTVVDGTTAETPGTGIYTHPELSWDAKKVVFSFKGEPSGSTCIYEIGIDGKGLRRLTNPQPTCACYKGGGGGQHDIAPAYLPDDRIVFLSTRYSGLVPCANSGVSILHVMNGDGTDIHPISVNFVHEFDPSILPDGRIMFGRWEYVDKNALTMQSLWTIHPDGTEETAVFKNNMVFPEAVLDARPVPDSHLVACTFAKHNHEPRGSIGFIDTRRGKNNVNALVNLEHPEDPSCDLGNSCEPWPLSENLVVFSGRPAGAGRNAIEMLDRSGHRFVVLSDTNICLHSPMLVKPRPRPAVLRDLVDRKAKTGNFFVQNIYQGLTGVKPGEVKWLRVLEETSRVSATPGGKQYYNQTFLVSAALAFSAKIFIGIVPVDENGSVYFEAPSGRALFFQALDADGRLIQSMRTFVQAAPGVTRSCIGCHEYKYGTAFNDKGRILSKPPMKLQQESWGSGHLDYPSMVQPVLDKNCVSCHGGEKGFAGGMDLSGGWTENFNISYENLVNRCETQLTAYWISGIDCMNGTALWSSKLFPPRSHGSGAAPLAKLLVEGHKGMIAGMTRTERDLLMAWMDSNGLYHGSWDYSAHGCAIKTWDDTKNAVTAQMRAAGCMRCHTYFENDWINLKDPELSRVLRAPLAGGGAGFGVGLCRDRKVDPTWQRLHLLWNGYAHAVQAPEKFSRHELVRPDMSGSPMISFASTSDTNYQAFLAIIREGRAKALAVPRVDMPGAEILAGKSRQFYPPPLPAKIQPPVAIADKDGVVHLKWERSARTIGLVAELHRAESPDFALREQTLLVTSEIGQYEDKDVAAGKHYYALVFISGEERSAPVYAEVTVPAPLPPPAPTGLKSLAASCSVRLQWEAPDARLAGYDVYRGKVGAKDLEKITAELVTSPSFSDLTAEIGVSYVYAVRAVGLRGAESELSARVEASAKVIKEPVFVVSFDTAAHGVLSGGDVLPAKLHAPATVTNGVLDVRPGGHVSFPHHINFDLAQPFSMECWVWMDQPGRMSVVVSCGAWRQTGWFLQQIGQGWRWHVGGVDCDGGKIAPGRWTHLAGVYDGKAVHLFQDGVKVGEKAEAINAAVFSGDLLVGQYSPQPVPDFQTNGRLAGVKIYHRPLAADEVKSAAATPPQAQR